MDVIKDSTDISTYFTLRDSTNHAPKTDVTITDIDLYYVPYKGAMAAKADATALAAADSAHADNKAFHVGLGVYRVDWPDIWTGAVGTQVQLIVVCAGVDTTFLEVNIRGAAQTGDSYPKVSPLTFTVANKLDANVLLIDSEAPETASDVAAAVRDIAIAGAAASSVGAAIASALADTNELQTDWVDGGRLDLILDAINAIVAHADYGNAKLVRSTTPANTLSVDAAHLVAVPTTQQVSLVDDAITASKFDESTAFPVKSADTGATAIARTGADSDTLETLSDQLDDCATTAEVNAAAANVSVDEIQATALADLFNTNSGTNYASAVAGSVVKEIADNAGGSALTESGIADAVWDEVLGGHVGAGSAGKAVADVLDDTGTSGVVSVQNIPVDGTLPVTLNNGAHTITALTVTNGIAVTCTTGDKPALALTGNGTGAGLIATGGSTSGNGMTVLGGAPNGQGVYARGDGSGAGIRADGGDSNAPGIQAVGGTTNGPGLDATGSGTGAGIKATSGNGATGNGIEATATSTNGDGIRTTGTGSGNGAALAGGLTGHGLRTVGGGTSGHGIYAKAAGTGDGLSAHGGGVAGDGIHAEADNDGDGLELVGVGSGADLTGDLPWNAAWDAEVQSECTDALNAYDPPTNAEMVARTLPSADYVVVTDTIAGATTVTNLTNAPTNGDFTAAMKASLNAATPSVSVGIGGIPSTAFAAGAIDAAALAADAGTEIAAAVWASAVRSLTSAASFQVKKNTQLTAFPFVMTDALTHAPLAALAVTAERSLDGAAFGACANAVSEIGNGWYKITLAAADVNANTVALRFSAVGADDLNLTVLTQS